MEFIRRALIVSIFFTLRQKIERKSIRQVQVFTHRIISVTMDKSPYQTYTNTLACGVPGIRNKITRLVTELNKGSFFGRIIILLGNGGNNGKTTFTQFLMGMKTPTYNLKIVFEDHSRTDLDIYNMLQEDLEKKFIFVYETNYITDSFRRLITDYPADFVLIPFLYKFPRSGSFDADIFVNDLVKVLRPGSSESTEKSDSTGELSPAL